MKAPEQQVARIVRRCLERGARVDIDGLGVFRRNPDGAVVFVPSTQPKVFIAYVQEDAAAAERLYRDFRAHSFDAWLDRKKLLPGQNWPRSIEQAIEVSDFFLACLSMRSVGKRGWFQSELRYALDCAGRVPFDEIYFIPVRLEPCGVPAQVRQQIQYVDLFPDWEPGFARILAAIRK
ncbi:MAG: TIR domain-containing protein [Acidobacteriota bacterium]